MKDKPKVTIPANEQDHKWLVIFMVTPRGGISHRGEKQFPESQTEEARAFLKKRPTGTASLWEKNGNNYVLVDQR